MYIKSYKKEEFSSNESDGFEGAGALPKRSKVADGEIVKIKPMAAAFAADDMTYLQKLHEIEASWLQLQRLYADLELEHQALREIVEALC